MSTVRCRRPAVPVFAAVAFAIVGCGPRDTGPTSPAAPSTRSPDQPTPADKGAPPVADPKAGPAESTPDAKLTAEEFSNAVKKDSNYLIAKHAGKLVELTGVVEAAKLDFGGDPVLLLNAGGKSYSLINCPVADRNHWSKAFPGQTVTLRGRAPTSAADPVPFVWHIQSAAGPQPAKMSVEDLVKEVVADPEATEKKYKGKHIILTGEVAEPKTHEGKLVGVRLGLKEKEPVVVCYAVGLGGEKETNFIKGVAKPGKKVTVVVEYEGYYAGKIDLRGPIIDPSMNGLLSSPAGCLWCAAVGRPRDGPTRSWVVRCRPIHGRFSDCPYACPSHRHTRIASPAARPDFSLAGLLFRLTRPTIYSGSPHPAKRHHESISGERRPSP